MVQDSEEFGSAQELGKGEEFPHSQAVAFSRLCPTRPHHSNQQAQAGADGRAWTDLRTVLLNVIVWEFQQDLRDGWVDGWMDGWVDGWI